MMTNTFDENPIKLRSRWQHESGSVRVVTYVNKLVSWKDSDGKCGSSTETNFRKTHRWLDDL